MVRVLHINDYPPDAGGGAEVLLNRTIALLRERGVEVDGFSAANLSDDRVTLLGYIDNTTARQALAAKLTAFEPDVVHLHNWYHVLSPGILATLADFKRQRPVRVLMTAHDYHLVSPNAGGCWFGWLNGARELLDERPLGLTSILTRRWDERTIAHSWLKAAQHLWNYRWNRRQGVIDLVLCPSRFVDRLLSAAGFKTCWLPHPAPAVELTAYERGDRLRLVFAGRIEPEKGLREHLEMLPDWFDGEFHVLGDGSELARCKAIAKSRPWGDRVVFHGKKTHAQTLAQLSRCHVLVQPSRVLETYGLTLIEGLAAGTNLLVTDRGAAREIVEDSGVGFLFDVNNAASLEESLAEIQRRHRSGTLLNMNVAKFLAKRDEANYMHSLLDHYRQNDQQFNKAA